MGAFEFNDLLTYVEVNIYFLQNCDRVLIVTESIIYVDPSLRLVKKLK